LSIDNNEPPVSSISSTNITESSDSVSGLVSKQLGALHHDKNIEVKNTEVKKIKIKILNNNNLSLENKYSSLKEKIDSEYINKMKELGHISLKKYEEYWNTIIYDLYKNELKDLNWEEIFLADKHKYIFHLHIIADYDNFSSKIDPDTNDFKKEKKDLYRSCGIKNDKTEEFFDNHIEQENFIKSLSVHYNRQPISLPNDINKYLLEFIDYCNKQSDYIKKNYSSSEILTYFKKYLEIYNLTCTNNIISFGIHLSQCINKNKKILIRKKIYYNLKMPHI